MFRQYYCYLFVLCSIKNVRYLCFIPFICSYKFQVATLPPSFKLLKPYLARAEELDRDTQQTSKLIAYYCRQHSMSLGLDIRKQGGTTGPETGTFLMSLMTRLESDKAHLPNPLTKVRLRGCKIFETLL